jgi:hypothetical protein
MVPGKVPSKGSERLMRTGEVRFFRWRDFELQSVAYPVVQKGS